MSAIRLRPNDNFSIITTATHRSPWGDCKAQVQVKTRDEELELTTDNVSHLNIILDALKQLLNDINDESLEVDQIRSRVFNSNDVTPIIREPLFTSSLRRHPSPDPNGHTKNVYQRRP